VSPFPALPDFTDRAAGTERMDDPAVGGAALRAALRDLRRINRLLGGLRASTSVLGPTLRARSALDLLDVGSGTGDYLAHLVRHGARHGTRVRATGVDLNPRTVGHGRAWLDATLPPGLRTGVRLEIADALALPYPDDAFDVAHAALFLHHFHGDAAVCLLREMNRVSRHGILINDLHRHPLAYLGIWALSRVGFSPMVQHDGPLSVRRGFRRDDLVALAAAAGLPSATVRWHWAFRWTLSSLDVPSGRPAQRITAA
jgi:SAM-dependent methyltransferase